MLIWINGTFGSGKTSTAYELKRRLKQACVYDPERFGFALMRNVPKELAKSDFQDYPLWREANRTLLKELAHNYNGIIIIPMTLTNKAYFEEIIGNLRDDGIEVKHFTLMASKDTVAKRLRKRFEGRKSWAYQQMKERMHELGDDVFATHLDTDNLSIDGVVETVAKRSGISLLPDKRSRLRKKMDRLKIMLQEIK
ncbi:AAA family ATPase [Oceanobacillus picturae]|uniref:AAA family ATPase n=1 Tax=Oceanobacillus picturae TaxID=171693 RepID=UPI0036305DC7